MNFKTTILLIVVLAGIGAYLFFTRSTSESPTSSKTEEARKLLDFKPEDVQRLAITRASGKPEVFERSGSDWKIVAPIAAPAESSEVDDLVREVVGMQSRGEMDADKKASLGLDHPAYTIELTSKDNKKAKIDVAEKPPLGDTAVVLVDGHDKPSIVSSSIYSRLDKKAETYRSTRLLSVSSDQIKQLSLTHKAQTIRLEKQGNDWEIVEPRKMPADSSEVSNLLFGISGLTAKKFPDGYSAQDAGLLKPKATIQYSLEAPTTSPATAPSSRPLGTEIKLGGFEDVTRDNIFIQIDGGPIATIAASTFDTFNKKALDLRDKKVVDIDPERVESIAVQIDRPATTQPTTRPAENRVFTIARRAEEQKSATTQPASVSTTSTSSTQPTTQPAVASTQPVAATQPLSKWVFRSGGDGNADEGQMSTLLNALHPLKADKFVDMAATTRPAATFTLNITIGPGPGSGPAEQTLRIVDPGGEAKLIGFYNDLVFEADRAIARDLEGDFKTKKVEATPPPSGPPPSVSPFGGPPQ